MVVASRIKKESVARGPLCTEGQVTLVTSNKSFSNGG